MELGRLAYDRAGGVGPEGLAEFAEEFSETVGRFKNDDAFVFGGDLRDPNCLLRDDRCWKNAARAPVCRWPRQPSDRIAA